MHQFYAAHRREPLFPLATKIWLALVDQSDQAVSFASATFSVFAVYLTYRVGLSAFSGPVGLISAALMAIEYQLITTGVEGWRDDAFTCGVLATTIAILAYARRRSLSRAAGVGAAGGMACLVRITSLSFVVPGVLCLLPSGRTSWSSRVRNVGVTAAVAVALVGPFLYNCWRVYGDPLYSINVHADVYRAAEGLQTAPSQTAAVYLGSQWRTRPARTFDTVALGLTAYPFANKWTGFDVWVHGAGRVLAVTSLIGLWLFSATAPGRVLLLIVLSSLVPYAFTWRLIADWRFTEHVYPFFLIAAALTMTSMGAMMSPQTWRARKLWLTRSVLAYLLTATVVTVAGWWILVRLLPVLTFEETLRANETAGIEAGPRDGAFFGRGWGTPHAEGNVVTRSSIGARAVMRVYLPIEEDLQAVLRLDDARPPNTNASPAEITILVNGTIVQRCTLRRDPMRMGACRFGIPVNVLHRGANTLALVPEGTPAVRVWYLRLNPGSAEGAARE